MVKVKSIYKQNKKVLFIKTKLLKTFECFSIKTIKKPYTLNILNQSNLALLYC